jgi:hypothetical protein
MWLIDLVVFLAIRLRLTLYFPAASPHLSDGSRYDSISVC